MLWLHVCLFTCIFNFSMFNKCEHVIVGIVLSEHSEKCDIAIFCHCHTQSVISVNETVETESCIIVNYTELHDFSFYWTLPQSYQFLWPWPLRVFCSFDQVTTSRDNLPHLSLCLCLISAFGWLSDKSHGIFFTLLVNSVVYTSVLTLCFSLAESLHQLLTVLHTSTLKTSAKILGKYSFHGASQRTLQQLFSFRNWAE